MEDCSDVPYEWKIENFSALKAKVRSPSFFTDVSRQTKCVMVLCPYGFFWDSNGSISICLNTLTENTSIPTRYELTVSVLSTDASLHVSKKKAVSCVKQKSYWGFYWFMSREELFAKSNVYLPEDVLTIQCYTVRKADIPDFSISEEDESPLQSVSHNDRFNNDLQRLNLDDEFSDIKITTLDRTFSVRKTVLCAMSPVFSAMFEDDTKVKESGIVPITDLDSETVNLMLKFLNSDPIENLNLDQVSKLYAASDKYKILPLKQRCSSVLKRCLSDANVCEIYTLADMHQDKDLKAAVEEYVFIYSTRILISSEWKSFMKSNPKLSAEFMHKLWIKQVDS